MVATRNTLLMPCGVHQTRHKRLAGQRVLGSDGPRIKGHSVIPAPPHHQNSVGTCRVPRVAQALPHLITSGLADASGTSGVRDDKRPKS